MKKIRVLIIAAALAAGALFAGATPAQSLVCHEGQSCDCSVRIKDKVIVPCNQ